MYILRVRLRPRDTRSVVLKGASSFFRRLKTLDLSVHSLQPGVNRKMQGPSGGYLQWLRQNTWVFGNNNRDPSGSVGNSGSPQSRNITGSPYGSGSPQSNQNFGSPQSSHGATSQEVQEQQGLRDLQKLVIELPKYNVHFLRQRVGVVA